MDLLDRSPLRCHSHWNCSLVPLPLNVYGVLQALAPVTRSLNVEVQQVSGRMIDLRRGFEAVSFSGASV
jgi:hypothetical protein